MSFSGFRAAALGAVAVLALGLAQPAAAQDSLYGKQPPPGSAFVRVINGLNRPLQARLPDGTQLRATAEDAGRVTPFQLVRDASRPLRLQLSGGREQTIDIPLKPEAYTTLVVTGEGAQGYQVASAADGVMFNKARARVSFHNLMPACSATLKLAEGDAVVFRDIGFGAAAWRDLNPVSTGLAAPCGALAPATITLPRLEPGTRTSLWLLPAGAGSRLILTTDAIAGWN
ncbi:alginate O-acetyltransferase AlgF [Roseomonas sp. 18066]|uniref:alginate O-acetyltransferase AlgF n=1 Tax=Roseomonas sp. 18066 TaxID=2681412 RepID=UPI001357FC51|nr:alginate O-acetyltransferase AlgF [Roseomonas sp. 18066]